LNKYGKEPTLFDYNGILYTCAKNRDSTNVKFWYELMKKDNQEPNVETFGIIIGSCCMEGNTARGLFFLSEMAHFLEEIHPKFLETISFMLKEDSSPKEAKLFQDLVKSGKVSPKDVKEAIAQAKQNPKYDF
jgi:pentatricopeptide repeat protein